MQNFLLENPGIKNRKKTTTTSIQKPKPKPKPKTIPCSLNTKPKAIRIQSNPKLKPIKPISTKVICLLFGLGIKPKWVRI